MKPTAEFSSFIEAEKLEVVYGQIVGVEDIVKSDKLIKLTVDFGSEYGTKTILAAIKLEFQEISFLNGLSSFFVLNFEPRKIMGHVSEGMILPFSKSGKMVLGGPTYAELPIGTKLF